MIKEGKVHFNNEETSLFPMAFGAEFDFDFHADLNSGIPHSTNMMEWFMMGDISHFLSYDMLFPAHEGYLRRGRR